jgi:hypothetical protein
LNTPNSMMTMQKNLRGPSLYRLAATTPSREHVILAAHKDLMAARTKTRVSRMLTCVISNHQSVRSEVVKMIDNNTCHAQVTIGSFASL